MTDQARLARACHLVVRVGFSDQTSGRFERFVRIDTAAPFSVLTRSGMGAISLALPSAHSS